MMMLMVFICFFLFFKNQIGCVQCRSTRHDLIRVRTQAHDLSEQNYVSQPSQSILFARLAFVENLCKALLCRCMIPLVACFPPARFICLLGRLVTLALALSVFCFLPSRMLRVARLERLPNSLWVDASGLAVEHSPPETRVPIQIAQNVLPIFADKRTAEDPAYTGIFKDRKHDPLWNREY